MAGQTDTVIRDILTSIEIGALNPGDTIDESELESRLGVSRTPLREALIQLEAQGLITRQPRKGAAVFRPTLEEFLAILEVHAHLEGQAAGLAARRMSRDNAARLEATVQACEAHFVQKGEAEPDAYYALNMAFHGVIAESAGNPFLEAMIKTNGRKLMAYYRARYAYVGAIEASAREHRAIATLIFDRNSDAAAAAMIAHVQFDHVTAMDLLAALS